MTVMSYSSLSVGTVRWGASCINFVVLVAENPLVVFVCDARIEIDRPAGSRWYSSFPPYLRTAAMASWQRDCLEPAHQHSAVQQTSTFVLETVGLVFFI